MCYFSWNYDNILTMPYLSSSLASGGLTKPVPGTLYQSSNIKRTSVAALPIYAVDFIFIYKVHCYLFFFFFDSGEGLRFLFLAFKAKAWNMHTLVLVVNIMLKSALLCMFFKAKHKSQRVCIE